MNTTDKGTLTEQMLICKFIEKNIPVMVPVGGGKRYDFVVDYQGKFLSVQCKTGSLRDGVIKFKTCSSNYDQKNGLGRLSKSYIGEVDLFGIYCPDNQGYYIVKVDDVGKSMVHLRLEYPKKKNKSIRWAQDFEFDRAFQ